MMPGMIDQIVSLGLERPELAKDHPRAEIGGARIPYPPKDLASLVSLLNARKTLKYLALEVYTMGAVDYLRSHLGYPETTVIAEANKTVTGLRKTLREMAEAFDLVSIDGRDLKLNAETLWRYIEGGGKSLYAKEFGKGAPTDYGVPKLNPGAYVVVNLAGTETRELWCRLRMRYWPVYQSNFVGMVHI